MRDVNSVEAALEAMRPWPVRAKKKAAYVICAEVLDGTKTVDDARKAFVASAKEAGAYREG